MEGGVKLRTKFLQRLCRGYTGKWRRTRTIGRLNGSVTERAYFEPISSPISLKDWMIKWERKRTSPFRAQFYSRIGWLNGGEPEWTHFEPHTWIHGGTISHATCSFHVWITFQHFYFFFAKKLNNCQKLWKMFVVFFLPDGKDWRDQRAGQKSAGDLKKKPI